MVSKKVGWELYRSFLAVMQEGSLSAAARATGSTQPTIGRHINELEKCFGYSLFIRTQTGLIPTDRALVLEKYARDMSHLASSLERASHFSEDSVLGTVRVTSSDIVGIELMPDAFVDIQQEFPEINIELVLSDVPQDLLNREADVAVRMFRPKQNQLMARKVGISKLGFFVSHRYLERRDMPSSVEELRNHPLIGFDQETDFIRRHAKNLSIDVNRDRFNYRADSNVAQLAMIRAGLGVGLCQKAVANRDENLIPVLEDALNFELEVWVTMHEDLKGNPACKAVFDGLARKLEDIYRVR